MHKGQMETQVVMSCIMIIVSEKWKLNINGT